MFELLLYGTVIVTVGLNLGYLFNKKFQNKCDKAMIKLADRLF